MNRPLEPTQVTLPDRSEASAVPGRTRLPETLSEAIRQLGALGEDFAPLADRLSRLRERLEQGRFHLAVLGQFKRGKSTLLNALLGGDVLPTGVVPLTAIPTFIRSGRTLAARVFFRDEREPEAIETSTDAELTSFLEQYVAETANPRNALGVSHVEVRHSAELLRRGLVLIDTPGIGSTHRHNTEATLNFLPQCDAAVFLVSADPPITEVEVAFLQQVRAKVARLFFVLNKVDYLSAEDIDDAVGFLRQVLSERAALPDDLPVFAVSARLGVEARSVDDGDEWETSGMARVERHLLEFLANGKAAALRDAVVRQASEVLADAEMRLRLARRSLVMPLADLETRVVSFEAKVEEARAQRETAADLLAGDARRLHRFLEEHAEHLRHEASAYLVDIAREALANGNGGEGAIRAALSEAVPEYFERQVGRTTELVRERISETLAPHGRRVDELAASVRRSAAELFEVPLFENDGAEVFEIEREPYWVTHEWSGSLGPLTGAGLESLLPRAIRERRLGRRVQAQVEELVVSNVENLRWAVRQSIDQTHRRFVASLDERLRSTIDATQGAIRAAMQRRRQHGEAIAEEATRLADSADDLERVRGALQDAPGLPGGKRSASAGEKS